MCENCQCSTCKPPPPPPSVSGKVISSLGKPFDFEGGQLILHRHAASYSGDKDVYDFTLNGRAKITRENLELSDSVRVNVI